jgi:hypothetical protein
MTKLFVVREDREQFDSGNLKKVLFNNPDVRDYKERTIGSAFQCSYSFKEDFTLVRLDDTLSTITLEGTGDSSLAIVVYLQESIATPLRMFVTNYNYDISVKLHCSISELRKAMDSELIEYRE